MKSFKEYLLEISDTLKQAYMKKAEPDIMVQLLKKGNVQKTAKRATAVHNLKNNKPIATKFPLTNE